MSTLESYIMFAIMPSASKIRFLFHTKNKDVSNINGWMWPLATYYLK